MESQLSKTYDVDSKVNLKFLPSAKTIVQILALSSLLAIFALAINYKFGIIVEEQKAKGPMSSFVIR